MEEHNIDKFFKQKLDDYGTPPPDGVWNGIEGELDRRSNATGNKFTRIGLLLLLLLFLGAGGYLIYQVNTLDQKVKLLTSELNEKQEAPDNTAKSLVENESQKTESDQNLTKDKSPNLKNNQNESREYEKLPRTNTENQKRSNGNEQNKKLVKTENQITEEKALAPIARDKATEFEKNTEKSSRDNTELQGSSNDKSIADYSAQYRISEKNTGDNRTQTVKPERTRQHVDEQPSFNGNLSFDNQRIKSIETLGISNSQILASPQFSRRDTDYYSLPREKFLLGAYGIASYNYRRITAENEGSNDFITFLDNSEQTAINYGGGLSLSYDLNKDWRVGIGLEYRKRVQEASYPILLKANEIDFTSASINGEVGWTYAENIESSLGNADFEFSETGFPYNEIETSSPPIDYETLVNTTRIQKVMRIPVILEYGLTQGSWRFLIGAGLAYDRVLSDRSSYSFSEFENVSFTQSSSTVGNYFSYHLGIAAEYSLTEKISLRLNPRYESWLTPVFKNDKLRTLPYSISVAAGVGIRF